MRPAVPQKSKLEICMSEKNDVTFYVGKEDDGHAYILREYGVYRVQLLDIYESVDTYECIWGEDEVQIILRDDNIEKVVSYTYEQLQEKEK